MSIMLNIGCGKHYHPDWINLDINPGSADVMQCDITSGLPFATGSVDVCYSSHVLEHLRKREAVNFIEEQKRVLRHHGILRIVVPDLETICRNYLKYLDLLAAGKRSHEFRYDYTLLELFDQVSRERTGGEMAKVLASSALREGDRAFLLERGGLEAPEIRQAGQSEVEHPAANRTPPARRTRILLRRANRKLVRGVVRLLMGRRAMTAFDVGLFRESGEVHRFMYDHYSISRLLSSHGFQQIKVTDAFTSSIPQYAGYELDGVNNVVRKPDSLFMEALRA